MHSSGQEREWKSVTERERREDLVSSFLACRLAVVAVSVCVAVMANVQTLNAQIPEPPLPVDPRPLSQLMSETDKALLSDANNPKELVQAYLSISDTHLQMALNAIRANNHLTAENELDVYNKAVAAASKEAFAVQEGKRSLSKKIEQTLYKQIKTLETIERLFPSEREVFAEAALKHTKQLRVQALNEAFASDVLKDPSADKKPEGEPPANEGASIEPTLPRLVTESVQRRVGFLGASIAGFYASAAQGPRVRVASFYSTRAWLRQGADYLTEEEDDHVRVAQAADARAKVFMKIADRRLQAIVGPVAPPVDKLDKKEQKKAEEEEREWGALPKASREELLRHYARAIAECMAKLEDAYERNPKSSALPKALALLRDATDKHLVTLRGLKPELKTDNEMAAITAAIYEAETANKGARDGLK
jgi:hypothetical protein